MYIFNLQPSSFRTVLFWYKFSVHSIYFPQSMFEVDGCQPSTVTIDWRTSKIMFNEITVFSNCTYTKFNFEQYCPLHHLMYVPLTRVKKLFRADGWPSEPSKSGLRTSKLNVPEISLWPFLPYNNLWFELYCSDIFVRYFLLTRIRPIIYKNTNW